MSETVVSTRQPAQSSSIGSIRSQQNSQFGLENVANLVTPYAVRVAATLRLADHITDGATDVPTLAQRCGANPKALRRLLVHLASYDVFTERADGGYDVGPVGQQLRSDHPMSMRVLLDLDSFSGKADLSLSGLLESVRTGEPVYPAQHGKPYWEDLVSSPAMGDSFETALDTIVNFSSRSLLRGYDWSTVKRIVDVGGGSGAPLIRLLKKYEHLQATLVDFPQMIERARRNFEAAGVADRASVTPGSYFDPLPPGADAYLLSEVVDQESEENAVRILRRCAEAAGDTGKVMLLQTPVTKSNRAVMTALDLRMLTSVGGQELSVEQYRELFAKAGLKLDTTYPASNITTFSVMLFVCSAA
ncbi:O-methyltransferase [Micromonospora echinaurantiaca]|uniref:O-methyltransferase n=1 Tax=Micromonospora echinaurantiaca TaxID=47857 RepID=A0A1C5HLT0_9ACTN|nr:O-methyltransferase [Micromonospora echinaurantiaca]